MSWKKNPEAANKLELKPKGMYVVGKGSQKDREVGKFYVGKFFPNSFSYIEDRSVKKQQPFTTKKV